MCEKTKSRVQETDTGWGPDWLPQRHSLPRTSVATPWPEGGGERARKDRGSEGKHWRDYREALKGTVKENRGNRDQIEWGEGME